MGLIRERFGSLSIRGGELRRYASCLLMCSFGFVGCQPVPLQTAVTPGGTHDPQPSGQGKIDGSSGSTVRVEYTVFCGRCQVFAFEGGGSNEGSVEVEGRWSRAVRLSRSEGTVARLSVVPMDGRGVRSARILVEGREAAVARPTGDEAHREVLLTVNLFR